MWVAIENYISLPAFFILLLAREFVSAGVGGPLGSRDAGMNSLVSASSTVPIDDNESVPFFSLVVSILMDLILT